MMMIMMMMMITPIIYYKVDDAAHCLTNVDDASASAQLLTATTLRNCLGTRNLGEILSEKESIATEMKEVLDVATKPWGVKVERVEVNEMFHSHYKPWFR